MLQEFKSEAELIAHYKAVRARVNQWKPPVKVESKKIEIVEPETCSCGATITVRYPTFPEILSLVCRHYEIPRTEMLSKRRHAKVVLPRQIVMWLARDLTLNTLPMIGRMLGVRDHTTILHGCRKIESLRLVSPEIQTVLVELKSQLVK